MRKFDLSLRSSRSSYFATFRHQLTILSKTDALDEEKWLNMLGTFVKDWFRYESHFVHGRRSEERFSRNAETDLVCRLLLEKKKVTVVGLNNPATMTLAPRGTSLYQTTYGNVAPRFGLAYQLGG